MVGVHAGMPVRLSAPRWFASRSSRQSPILGGFLCGDLLKIASALHRLRFGAGGASSGIGVFIRHLDNEPARLSAPAGTFQGVTPRSASRLPATPRSARLPASVPCSGCLCPCVPACCDKTEFVLHGATVAMTYRLSRCPLPCHGLVSERTRARYSSSSRSRCHLLPPVMDWQKSGNQNNYGGCHEH